MLELRLLGPPGVFRNGESVRLLKKSLALLAFLAMEPERPHERAFLSDLLWPELPKSRADNSLRFALHSLRKIADTSPLFSASRTHVVLPPTPSLWTDGAGLLRPPDSCSFFHDPEVCASCEARMRCALGEIRGPFMNGFFLPDCEEFENWITGMREELLMRIRFFVNNLVRLNEKRGNIPEAIFLLDRSLAFDPLDEACHGRKMLLLAESGNFQVAQHQYEVYRKILREQVGKEPDPEIEAIREKILACSGNRVLSLIPHGPVFPDLAFSPEWRPATTLSLEFASEDEEEYLDTSDEIESLLSAATGIAGKFGGQAGGSPRSSLLYYFGTSSRTDGAAKRAAQAALEIRRLLQGETGEKRQGIALTAGIHSGRILRGAPSTPLDPTGTVSRTAMALSMRASPGEILVSERTARLLQGQFDLIEAGEIGILGQRIDTFVLEGPVHNDHDSSVPDSGKIVGRERELASLARRWREGCGGVVVVEGEAGIGKTALIRTFLGSDDLQNARIRRVECAPQFTASPFFPFIKMIRGPAQLPEGLGREEGYARLTHYARTFSFDDERRAVAILGHFFSLPPHPSFPLPGLSASHLREETANLLLTILKYRALEGKGLYLIEDLHWLDVSSGELLRKVLLDRFFTERILFLLTTRTGEEPSWLREVPNRTTLRLAPLEDGEARTMIRNLVSEISKGGLSGKSEDSVVRLSDGVPLFIEELVRERLDRGENTSGNTRYRIPETLDEVLASRLDHLGEARSLVQMASVYGRVVPLPLLRSIFSGDPATFDVLLAQAQGSDLVSTETDLSGDSLTFRHALIVEAARLSIPRSTRLSLHAKIAEILRDSFPEKAMATPELVALHFEEAGLLSEAVPWFEKAARNSYEKGSFFEAQHFLDKAYTLLSRMNAPESDDPTPDRNIQSRLLILRGNLLLDMKGQGNPVVQQSFRKALDILEGEDDVSDEVFQALYGYWDSLYGGRDLQKARKTADSLGNLSQKSTSSTRRIVACFTDGCTAFWEGRFSRSFERLSEGLSLGKKECAEGGGGGSLLREAALVQSTDYQLWNLWFLGHYRSALSSVEENLEHLSENVQKKGHLLTFSAVTLRYLRLPERALEVLDILKEVIDITGIEGWKPSETGFRGWAQVMTGDPSGIVAMKRGLALSRKLHRMGLVKYLAILAEGYLACSNARKARGIVTLALKFSKRSGAVFFDADLWRLQGEAAFLAGEREEATECFRTALAIGRKQGARALELRAATSLGKLFLATGKRKKGLALLSDLSELLDGPEADPTLPDIREALDLRRQFS